MKKPLLLTAALLAVLAGCASPTDDDAFSDQLVVNAYLFGGEPIDSVYIQHTWKVTEAYTAEKAAVTNAVVIITGNNIVDTLAADPARPGRYASKERNRRVQPGAAYSLLVRVPGYGDVTGTTMVPDTFSVLNAASFPKTASYAPSTNPFRIEWSRSGQYADYMLVVRSADQTTAMIPASFHNEDNKPERTSVGFFLKDVNACEISWLYFNYYGPTEITMAATDRNYFEFLKQFVTAQQSSDLKEIRFNLNGAIGVFGSETIAKNRIALTITQ
ncbi:MAG: DUF4249 family protein [Acidobacteriota bacterium]